MFAHAITGFTPFAVPKESLTNWTDARTDSRAQREPTKRLRLCDTNNGVALLARFPLNPEAIQNSIVCLAGQQKVGGEAI